MEELSRVGILSNLFHLLMSALVGGIIGYERRLRHKAIGVAGMIMVATGSTTYMLLSRQVADVDPAALGRAIQGLLQGIGFIGGAVIFKGGTDVRGIKTAAAIWITGAIGLAIGLGLVWLGLVVGFATAAVLFIADMTPRRASGEDAGGDGGDDEQADKAYGKAGG